MTHKTLKLMSCLVLLTANAAFAEDDEAEVVEKVAVRNRLFSVEGRWEVGGMVGFSLLSRLTDHYNLNASVGYNVKDWFALEVRGGYAISRHTSLADQIQEDFFKQTTTTRANDASDLWQLGGHGVIGARFQPIYGKINLMSELPVHFQFFLWVGGGVAQLTRESLVLCPDKAACGAFFKDGDGDGRADRSGPTPFVTDTKVSPLVSLALGFRFFIEGGHAVKLEVRDWSYLDSYFVNVDRSMMSVSNPTAGGSASTTAGITNLVQFELGYSFIF